MARVLQVIFHDPVNFPLTLNTSRVLAAEGHEVTCLGFDRGRSSPAALPAGARIEYLDRGQAGYPTSLAGKLVEPLWFRWAVSRAIARERPALVIAYDAWGMWGVAPHVSEVPVVYHIHDLDFSTRHPWIGRERHACSVAERAIPRCRLLVLPAAERLARLRETIPVPIPTAIVANCPPLTRPERNDVLRDQIAARTGTRPPFLAVVIGNMGLLQESVAALTACDARWHLAFVGTQVPGGAPRLLRYAASLGVGDRFHYLPYTAYDTVRLWLRGCDVGLALHPRGNGALNQRLLGTGSVKVMEYLAAGLPAIVNRACSFEPLAEETGALSFIEEETASAIAAALDRLRPTDAAWTQAKDGGLRAHATRYHAETQLTPIRELLSAG